MICIAATISSCFVAEDILLWDTSVPPFKLPGCIQPPAAKPNRSRISETFPGDSARKCKNPGWQYINARQTAVADYLESKQLLLFAIAG